MIEFLHPWALLGLAAATIPVLLHLLARREPPTVVFPAVRYLITTTQEHLRRLKLQNLLLLIVRTALIGALVLAAAGPTVPRSGLPSHAPSALVLILDNSPSSGALVSGTSRLARLQDAARTVLSRATPSDALWLVTADGVPVRGTPETLRRQVDALAVAPYRLDLGASLALAGEVLATDSKPGEVVLLSDLQATAVSPADVTVPLVVGRPDDSPPRNAGIGTLETGPQPWSTDGGRITVSLVGDSGAPLAVTARLGDRPARQVLASVGPPTVFPPATAQPGWWTVTAELDPDELRLDDRRLGVVRVAPVARVDWDSASRYVAAACEVLETNRRIARGREVTLGRLAAGNSIVTPPEDAASIGALNRALAARGVSWSYGDQVTTAATTDTNSIIGRTRVLRRYQLRSTGSGRTGVLVTAGGGPWVVRSGNVVLLGSLLDPAWTDLPVSAGFMPFMDALLNRLSRGEVALSAGTPGDPVELPDVVTGVRQGEREWRVEGGGLFRPLDIGVYYLLTGEDTVGALTANTDPRESRLERASDAQVRRLWHEARVLPIGDAGVASFSAAGRGDLRGPLLWLALLLGLAEMFLASARRRTET
jgi:hypothetical protein